MYYLRNELNYLEGGRVNQWPDRMDRAMSRRSEEGTEKICRPDRFVAKTYEGNRRLK